MNNLTSPTMLEYRVLPIKTNVGTNIEETAGTDVERLDPARTTVLTCTRGGNVLWRERVTGRAALLAGNGKFCAMVTTFGTLYLYTEGGRRMSTPIVLPEPLAFLEVCTSSHNDVNANAELAAAASSSSSSYFSSSSSSASTSWISASPKVPSLEPSNLLIGLTITGTVYVWDVVTRRLVLKSTECVRSLLSSVESELRAHVHLGHDEGNDPTVRYVRGDVTRLTLRLTKDANDIVRPTVIITILADSSQARRKAMNAPVDANALRLCQSFVYDDRMEQWNRVADHHYSKSDYTSGFGNNLRLGGGGFGSVGGSNGGNGIDHVGGGMHPLDSLQATGHDIGSITTTGISDLFEWGDTSQQWYETRAHLEHQINASMVMQSSIEYAQWTVIYCKFLARDGRVSSVQRLRELCNSLLGPPISNNRIKEMVPNHIWSDTVMNIKKRVFLRSRVLPAIATNRALQRIVNEYQDALDQLST